ncbi:MAG: response regulator [Gemmatimonadota bacterium]
MRRRRVILLVHPQDENRVTWQVVLKREGYAIVEAVDAAGALEVIRDSVPDLVITEMRLPRNSGGDLIRTIRGDTSFPRLRVLALGDEAARAEALAAGADAYATVPVPPKQLVKLVASLIGRA